MSISTVRGTRPEPASLTWTRRITDLITLEAALKGSIPMRGWFAREEISAAVVELSVENYDAVSEILQRAWIRGNGIGGTGFWLPEWNPAQIHFLTESNWPANPLLLGRSFRPDRVARFAAARDALLQGEPTPHLLSWSAYPHMLGILRMAEVALGLTEELPPLRDETRPSPSPTPRALMSTPTDRTGGLAPGVLLDRLRSAEEQGWQPWPLDLEQALLRLPRQASTSLAEQAASLSSTAGRRFAAWVRKRGLPGPEQQIQRRSTTRPGTLAASHRSDGLPTVELRIDGEPRSGLHRAFFNLDPDRPPGASHTGELPVPAEVFPNYREVICAWALTDIACVQAGFFAESLLLNQRNLEPVAGPATTLVLAYSLGSGHPPARAAAARSILWVAGTGYLDGILLGRQLGALLSDGYLVPERIYPELIEVGRRGAHVETRDVILSMLPYVLDGTLVNLAELLALCTDLVNRFGVGVRTTRELASGLSAMGRRFTSGRTLLEARRLLHALETHSEADFE